MKNYYRVMLGRQSAYAAECRAGGFIGADYGIKQDLTPNFTGDVRAFNRFFIPVYLAVNREKGRVAAGLAGGQLWTIAKKMQEGDIILSPDGERRYLVGEVSGGYIFTPRSILPHRRAVRWFPESIERVTLSEALRNSAGSALTVSDITRYSAEIEQLIGGVAPPSIVATDATIEDPAAFAMERHLEDFLVKNWAQTELARAGYEIYRVDNDVVGQQFPTDTGPIDILAVNGTTKTLLVVELKKGRASDAVVGQILRYMGYVKDELAEEGQTVRGTIIALDDDQRIRRALSAVPNIDFYRYEITFKLSRVAR